MTANVTNEIDPTLSAQRGWHRSGVDVVCVVIAIGVAFAVWAPRLTGPIDPRSDGAVYYILGTSIYEGKGYRMLNEPGEIRAVQYPPGLPVIVAMHQWAMGTSDFIRVGSALRITFMLASLLLAGLTYRLSRLYLPAPTALAATLIPTLSLMVYSFSDLLYTETPFALVIVIMAILHHRARATGGRWSAAGVGAVAIVGFLIRTAGLALLVAWVAEAMLRREWKKSAIRAVITFLPVLLWNGYVASVVMSDDYKHPTYPYQRASYYYSNVPYADNAKLIDPFKPELGEASTRQVIRRTLKNTKSIPVAMTAAMTAPFGDFDWIAQRIASKLKIRQLEKLSYVPMIAISAAILLGAVVLWRKKETLLPLIFVASVGLICLTPWPEQYHRYLTPLAPVMAIFFVAAADWAWRNSTKSDLAVLSVRIFVTAIVVGVVLLEAHWARRILTFSRSQVTYFDADGSPHTAHHLHFNQAWVTLDAAAEWIRRNAAPSDVMAVVAPHTEYVRTGVKAVMPPLVTDPAEEQRLLDAVPVRFVIIDATGYPDTVRYVEPIFSAYPDRWKLVHTETAPDTTRARVYERVRDN